MLAAVLILISSLGSTTAAADLVEINHIDRGSYPEFVQVIAWDWSHDYARWHAQGWRGVEGWQWSRVGTLTRFVSDGRQWQIRSKLFRETWTKGDPEIDNRREFPERFRRRVW